MSADVYQEWCRDAMLPRALGYGEQRQTWYRYEPGWQSDEPYLWLPRNRQATKQVPTEAHDVREVWIPTEANWLDWLTTAGYSLSFSGQPSANRFLVALVQSRGPVISAAHAVSWAHGLALCWAQTADGLKHFERLAREDGDGR